MSKKSERVTGLIKCVEVLTRCDLDTVNGKVSYRKEEVDYLIDTLKSVLFLDGISSTPANSKVGKR